MEILGIIGATCLPIWTGKSCAAGAEAEYIAGTAGIRNIVWPEVGEALYMCRMPCVWMCQSRYFRLARLLGYYLFVLNWYWKLKSGSGGGSYMDKAPCDIIPPTPTVKDVPAMILPWAKMSFRDCKLPTSALWAIRLVTSVPEMSTTEMLLVR